MSSGVVKLSRDPENDAYAVYSTVVEEFITYSLTEEQLRSEEYVHHSEIRFSLMMARVKETGTSGRKPFDYFSWDYKRKPIVLRKRGRDWYLQHREDLSEFLKRLEAGDTAGALKLCRVRDV